MDRREKQKIRSAMRKIIFSIIALFIVFTNQIQGQPFEFEKHDNVLFASPEGFDLTMDIYVPKTGKENYPVLVIWHGGGWLINNETIMDEMAAYVASVGEYVVCNVNYRLLGDQENTVSLNEIVEDVFGSLVWIKYNIDEYGGDPNRIGITGDSAGGHLTSMVLTHGRMLESDGFDGDSFGFTPSWMPEGISPEELAANDILKVQAAVVSYGAFNMEARVLGGFETALNGFWQWAGVSPRGVFGIEFNVQDDPEMYRAVSPYHNIPSVQDYKLPPQYHHVGNLDQTTPELVIKEYVDLMEEAGQEVEFRVFEGFTHAYLDSGCNDFLQSCFESHAVPALETIIPFLDKHLKN
jgi:acetyl esterase/lipase